MSSPATATALLSKVRTTTQQAREKKESKTTDADFTAFYTPLLDTLTAKILENWESKINAAAERGFNKTNLFLYQDGQRWNGTEMSFDKGSALAFLLKGPRGEPNFWENKGFKPVFQRVQEAVAPFDAKMWFTGHRNGTVIEVVWDSEESSEQ